MLLSWHEALYDHEIIPFYRCNSMVVCLGHTYLMAYARESEKTRKHKEKCYTRGITHKCKILLQLLPGA